MYREFQDLIPLIASVSDDVYAIDFDHVLKRNALIDRSIAVEIMSGDLDYGLKLLRTLNIEPIPLAMIREEGFMLCRDVILSLGSFQWYIDPKLILEMKSLCSEYLGFVHSHPIPLPIPTPEDIVNAYQISSKIECIVSKVYKESTLALCIYTDKWMDILRIVEEFSLKIMNISRFIVVHSEDNEIYLLPYPSTSETLMLSIEFVKKLNSEGLGSSLMRIHRDNEIEFLCSRAPQSFKAI